MSEVRAITNLIGNAVATVAIARWDGALDLARAGAVLAGKAPEPISSEFASAAPPRDE
jgi:aerobic C4-dicarboxylate transport protein